MSAWRVPDFANSMPNGYDFDARFDEGLAIQGQGRIAAIAENGRILSKKLKLLCNYTRTATRLCDRHYLRIRHDLV
jgi:hypothetical protein